MPKGICLKLICVSEYNARSLQPNSASLSKFVDYNETGFVSCYMFSRIPSFSEKVQSLFKKGKYLYEETVQLKSNSVAATWKYQNS